jgi:hypothetical protein
MRRFVSTVSALGIAVPLLLLPAAPVRAVEATSRVDNFRACIAGGGATEMLLVFDESSSLNGSDPEDARVTSAQYLLDQLASFADSSTAKVNVAVSVFANTYSEVQRWTSLNSRTRPQLEASLASLKDRVNGMETDYWTALDGARKSLAARAASHPAVKSCQAVVWFTDGAINYTVRESNADKDAFGATKPFAPNVEITSEQAAEQVKQAAMGDICRKGGVADQLRSSNVALFGIGLQGLTTDPSDFSFLQSVVAGKSDDGQKNCGGLLNPVPGEFHLATDIDSMLLAFDGISSPGSSPIVQQTGICQVSRCTDQAHRFVLDASTPAVRVLATADGTGLRASLMSPSGRVVDLPKRSIGAEAVAKSDGNTLKYTWLSDKTLSMSMSAGANPSGWSGLWELAFTDGAGQSSGKTSKSSIHITGDLQPKWLNADSGRLHINEKIENILLGIVNSSGKAIKPSSLLGSIKLRATLTSTQGKSTVIADALDKENLTKPLTLNLEGYPVGAATLSLALSITTAASKTPAGVRVSGTTLEPVLVAVPLNLLPPAQFPVLAPRIDFGQVEGSPEIRADLPISGTGCAWIRTDTEPEIIASPDNVGKIDVLSPDATGPASCQTVQNSKSMALTFKSDEPGNGTVNGRVTVMVAPEGEPDKAIPVKVDFTASLAKPLNSTNFLVTLLVALILGPGIPLLLLYIAKVLVTKIPGRSLSAELISISLANSQLLRDDRPFQFLSTDFTDLIPVKSSGTRSLTIHGVNLSTRIGLSPIGPGYVLASAPAKIGVSSTNPGTDRSGVKARLPLAVHNNWIVLRDTDADHRAAFLLVLASGDATAAQKKDLEDDINRRVPDALRRLESLTGETSAAEGNSRTAFGGSSSASPDDASGFRGFGDSGTFAPTTPIDASAAQLSARAVRGEGPKAAPEPRSEPGDSEEISPWGNPYS